MRLEITLLLASAFQAYALQTADNAGQPKIAGVVVDDETGHALAWTQLTLTPLPGSRVHSITAVASERGGFTFNPEPGLYILRASRPGYADAEVGQMRAGRPGTPLEVAAQGKPAFFQLRLRHLAAITGLVLDSNNVGIGEWPVHVYTSRPPVRHVAEALTDERGAFRIALLPAGAYLVRSGAGTLDDNTALLPTYYRDGNAVRSADVVRVRIAETRPDVTIRPVKGRLSEISGIFASPVPANLTLITDTGRRVIANLTSQARRVAFTAKDIPPGEIELESEGQGCGSYERIILDRDMSGMRVSCGSPVRVYLNVASVTARRVSLDTPGPARQLRPGDSITPGNWEILPQSDANHYVTSVAGASSLPDGWFSLPLRQDAANIQVEFSPRAASVSGTVKSAGKPEPGAEVYLEMFNPDTPRARMRLWTTRSDAQGAYTFAGLAPGTYRILSSFDFDPETDSAPDAATAFTLGEAEHATKHLETVLP